MRFLRHLLASILINTAIAVLLTAIGIGQFGPTLVISQSIGLSIYGACMAVLRLTTHGPRRLLWIMLAVPAGALAGVMLGLALTGFGALGWLSPIGYQALIIGLIFGSAITYVYYARERMTVLEAELKERQLREAVAEKERVGAQLRALQAQIEPHFLFNTLANLSVLIRSDPDTADRMLADLIRYLRATLARARADQSTLRDEVEMLRSYLDILKLRMGSRLSYAFDVPGELMDRSFPPMLLQPLVENAVKHGLEPKVEGGQLRVEARHIPEGLRIAVCDSGVGLPVATPAGGGLGLENVRQRLNALYGEAGRLEVSENQLGGVTATLQMP